MAKYDELVTRLYDAEQDEAASVIRAQSKHIAELEAHNQKQVLDIVNLGQMAGRTIQAETELKRTRAALDIAWEYFDNRQDVNWEGDGPNDTMKCLQEINEIMGK